MKSSTLLMKPFLAQLEQGFSVLNSRAEADSSEDGAELRSVAAQGLKELKYLQDWIFRIETDRRNKIPDDFYQHFRKLKLDLRFAHRKWLRMLSNEARLRRVNSRRTHVSTFAA